MKLAHIFFLASLLILTGCTTFRREQAPELLLNASSPVGFQPDIRYVSSDPNAIKSRFSEVLRHLRATSHNKDLNILALSGGGAGGSFGAGAIFGLGQKGKRPQFDIVTGVSAGALIAPFAFLGSDWDSQLEEYFSGKHSEHFLVSRGLGMLSRPGIYLSDPLIKFVDTFVTDDMLKAVAAQAALGRMLLIATTDLDKEETVIWDMGKIAARGGKAAHDLFRDVLVASSSIPGVFEPIIIPVEYDGAKHDEMHIDASATVPFFVAPALAYVLPLDSDVFKGANIYIIINGQLGSIPHTTEPDTISILSRSFSAVLNHMAKTQIALTSAFAKRYGMNLKLTDIPIEYPFMGPLEFHAASSRNLFSYASDCAQAGKLWNTVEQSIAHNEKSLSKEAKNNDADDGPISISCPLDDSELPIQVTTESK
jgi:hypothetical protein